MHNHTIVECEVALSVAQQETISTFSWWLDTFFYLLVGMMGLLLNLLAMWILLTPSMWNNFFNRLILCLSGYDSVFILCGLLEIFRRKFYFSYIQQYMFANFFYPFRSMAMCCSIYTTMALTLERYQAIISPIQYRNRSANTSLGKRLFIYIVPIMLCSFLYYLPKFFDLIVTEETECQFNNHSTASSNNSELLVNDEGEHPQDCQTKHSINPTMTRINPQYIFWYLNVSNLMVTCVLPIGLLVFMNCRIATSLNEYRQRRPTATTKANETPAIKAKATRPKTNSDVKQTFMLFSIVILFVLCHSLRIILNITEFLSLETLATQREKGCDGISFWQHICMPLSEFLLLFNSSANFFVYMLFDKGFQLILIERFSVLVRYFTRSGPAQPEVIAINGDRLIVPEIKENSTQGNEIELIAINDESKAETAVTVDTSIQNMI